ncbi:Protein HLH-11 c [Aphelenchoides avenae]|nr:Protein HLH-11 c [Aphelenchus avenae]
MQVTSSVDTKTQNFGNGGRDQGTPTSFNNGKLEENADIGPADDRRLRRQIANCNERRRMQSINAGFQALRHLLPRKDGEKLSKAAILQQTADFVHNLLAEKERQMRDSGCLAAKKRRTEDRDGPELMDAADAIRPKLDQADIAQYIRTIDELRGALTKEQQLRMAYEQELVEIRRYAASLGLSQNVPLAAALSALLNGSSQLGHQFNRPDNTNSLLLNRPYADLSTLAMATQGAASAYLLSGALNLSPSQNAQNAPNVTYHQLQPVLVKPQPPAPEVPVIERSASAWPNGDAANAARHSFAPTMTSANPSVTSATLRDAIAAHNAADPGSVAQRNLQAILDAIRHIEGGVRPSSAPHQSDVMVS